MAFNSMTGFFAMGEQANSTTQATTLVKALAVRSGLGVVFEEGDEIKEHPSPAVGTSFLQASPKTRTGFNVPWLCDFVFHPVFLPMALRGMGFAVTSGAGPEANTYEHVCTVEPDADIPWMSVFSNIGGTAAGFTRAAIGARGEKLNMTASQTDIRWSYSGNALNETNVSGTPTYVGESTIQILPTVSGSFTCNFDGGTLATQTFGMTMNLDQVLDRDRRNIPLFSSTLTDMPRKSIHMTGDLQDIYATHDLWKKIIRGGTSGTVPSLTVVTGDLNYKFNSASLIGATATPYSAEFDFPVVQYNLPNEGMLNNNDDLVRSNISYSLIAEDSNAITIKVINGTASY